MQGARLALTQAGKGRHTHTLLLGTLRTVTNRQRRACNKAVCTLNWSIKNSYVKNRTFHNITH